MSKLTPVQKYPVGRDVKVQFKMRGRVEWLDGKITAAKLVPTGKRTDGWQYAVQTERGLMHVMGGEIA